MARKLRIIRQKSRYDSGFRSNSEIICGAKFIKMYESSEDHKTTILDLSKIDAYEKVNI
ncbi:MAG TPA: hypothetical protein PKV58_00990 [Kaistella sp.]|nr:hypothetical protein [Kaistella sp.]HPZ24493.1 hypothetical protein [Kaistella sp.]